MNSSLLRKAAPVLATSLLLTACGGGGDSSGSGSRPLGSANRETAVTDAISMSVDGSLAAGLSGYYMPASIQGTTTPTLPRVSLRYLAGLLEQPSGTPSASAALATSAGVAIASTVETTDCLEGGTVSLTSNVGSAVWSYSNCADGEGFVLNGQISGEQVDEDSYAGEFTNFRITYPGDQTVVINGRLINSSNATISELEVPSLSISMADIFGVTLRNYLIRFTDEGSDTRIDARGEMKASGAVSYHIRFDNTALDPDQAPFYLTEGADYPYTGKLEIIDTQSSARITIDTINDLQVVVTYFIGGLTELVWKDWSDLMGSPL